MPVYKLDIAGKTYSVDAPNEDVLPEIVDQIAGEASQPAEGSMAEYGGAIARGALPTVAGGGVGLALGGLPGAIAGVATVETGNILGDIGLPMINQMMGTRFATPSEGWKYLADKLGLPEAKSEGAKIAERVTRDVGSTLGTIGFGGLLKSAATAGSRMMTVGEVLSAAPKQQIAAAAAGGAAGEGSRALAESLGAGEELQAAANLAGTIAGTTIGGRLGAARNAVSVSDNPIIQAYQETGLKTPNTSEVMEPKTLVGKLVRTMGANVPVIGSAAREERRAAEVSAGIDRLLNRYGVEYGTTAPFAKSVVDDLAAVRGEKLGRLVSEKDAIIDSLERTGVAVPVPTANRVLNAEIEALRRANPEEFAPLITKFENIKNNINGNTLKMVDTNLELTGTMLKDPSVAAIAKQGQPGAKRIYDAIKTDIGNFVETNAGAAAKGTIEDANAALHGMVEEIKNRSLRQALRTGGANPDDVGKMLIDTKNPASFNLILSGLSEDGKQFAKQSVLQSIANRSINPASGELSPEKFRSQLNGLDQNLTKLFSPNEKKMLDAWATVIESSKFSRFFAPDAPTGVRTVIGTTLTALGSMAVVKAALGAAAHHVYESKMIRDLLLKISKNPANKDALSAQVAHLVAVSGVRSAGEMMINQNIPITFDEKNVKTEQLGQGSVTTDMAHGYRAVSTNGTKQRLYGPDNQMIGVFANMDEARRYTDRQVVNKIKVPRNQSYAP